MLALETNDNWGWQVNVTIASSTAEYDNTAGTDIVTSMQAFIAWVNSPSRPWAWAGSFWAWAWSRNGGASSPTSGGGLIRIYRTAGDATMTVASAGGGEPGTFPATTGIAYFSGQHDVTGSASAAGTWVPLSGIMLRSYANLLGSGDAGGGNVLRPGVQAFGNSKPKATAVGNVADMTRLQAVQAAASNPRRCMAWQLHTATWLQLALGQVTWTRQDVTFYQTTLDMSGGTM